MSSSPPRPDLQHSCERASGAAASGDAQAAATDLPQDGLYVTRSELDDALATLRREMSEVPSTHGTQTATPPSPEEGAGLENLAVGAEGPSASRAWD